MLNSLKLLYNRDKQYWLGNRTRFIDHNKWLERLNLVYINLFGFSQVLLVHDRGTEEVF